MPKWELLGRCSEIIKGESEANHAQENFIQKFQKKKRQQICWKFPLAAKKLD